MIWIRTRLAHNVFLPALSGLLLLLSFPSFSLSYFGLFAWVPLLVSLKGKGSRRAFQSGWITGLLFFGFWAKAIRRLLNSVNSLPSKSP